MLRAQATDRTDVIAAGLVLRAVGYRGAPVPGYPFDDRAGRIPNVGGRIIGADGAPLAGRYVAGWIKRGPQGVIGTNKADAGGTVAGMIDDLANGRLPSPSHPTQQEAAALLAARVPGAVSWADWRQIDQRERDLGEPDGRPRRKFTSLDEMLAVLGR